jgi:hypothetical protein
MTMNANIRVVNYVKGFNPQLPELKKIVISLSLSVLVPCRDVAGEGLANMPLGHEQLGV